MTEYEFATVDVFTSRRFGGNPLAVFYAANGLSDADMQALATEMNLSETSFVLPPVNPRNTARVRIFNRTHEMPFAGHPNVGTAYVLAKLGLVDHPVLHFEEIAGLVEVRLADDAAEIDAPQKLQIMGELPVATVARCISLTNERIVTTNHLPVRATTGVDFVFVEVEAAALEQATPDLTAFREGLLGHSALAGRLSIFVYALDTSGGVRGRMFAPLTGTWEDAATGSANATLAALRLSLTTASDLAYSAIQGVEMGRPSELKLRAWKVDGGIKACVGGHCVTMFSGRVIV